MTPQQEQRHWKRELEQADKREKAWRENGKKIYTRYRGAEKRRNTFNILWANTEVLRPALFNSVPKPDVRRRFRDADPLGKAVGEIMERALTYSIDCHDFVENIQFDVLDSLLPGRGVSRVRFVPSFRQVGTTPEQHAVTDKEAERSHEAQEGDTEELEYEQVTTEHVDWEHFRHGYGKTWAEVQWVAFWCQLNKKDVEEKFGPEIAAQIKYDDTRQADDDKRAEQDLTDGDRVADFWEIWDKQGKKVFFLQKNFQGGLIYPLDNPTGEPPMSLYGFFPVPRPLRMVEDSSSLLPIPLWDMYKEQAEELDKLSARINKIINALKVRGVYDATLSEMGNIMSGEDNDMLPLANAAAFRQAGGLEKAIWWMPIEQAAKVLMSLYDARDRAKQVIFEITGLSDITRGQTNPNETLGAQKIKANYSSMRLQRTQREVQRYVRDILRIMGEVIGEQFQAQTLQQMTGLTLPTPEQKLGLQQQAMQAQQSGQPMPEELEAALKVPTWDEVMQVLKSDQIRSYRVDVETDSTVQESLDSDMQGLQEVLTGLTGLWSAVGPAVRAGAIKIDAVKQISLTIVRRARLGIAVEDAIDQGMQQPPPPPAQEQPQDNSLQVEAQRQAAENQRTQMTLQATQATEAARMQADQAREQAAAQLEQFKVQAQESMEEQRRAHDAELKRMDMERQAQADAEKLAFERWKVEFTEATKILVAQISAKASLDQAAVSAQQAVAQEVKENTDEAPGVDLVDMHGKTLEAIQGVMQQLARPKRRTIQTDAEGRAIGVLEE